MSRGRKEVSGVDAPDAMGLEGGSGHYTSAMFGLRAEGYELKGDGKKRKFKPFEAVRKFFGKSKRKAKDEQVSVVAVKAKSTTALHNEEEDDDGGFKGHQPRPLGGNRSISEDSVFSPEQRETNLQALKQSAVSEESLPKSAFQAELFSKLSKRRSQYSDEDDGLPHSPTPPVTTADIIMGGPLKPLPAGGKSTSRESDKSLISMDGSENEEDDPFQSKWQSSVPSRVSRPNMSPGAEGPIDFEKMTNTELLKSDAAKDRISIKPRARKATRKSQKKRDGSSPHSLPSLNEESPTKSGSEEPVASPKKAVTPQDSVVLEVSVSSDKQEQPQVTLVEKTEKASSPKHPEVTKKDSLDSSQAPQAAPLATSPAKSSPIVDSSEKDEVKRSSLKSTVTVSSDSGGISAKRASFEGSGVKVKETVVTTTSENKTVVSTSVTASSEPIKKDSFRDTARVTISSQSSSIKQKGQADSESSSSSKTQMAPSIPSQSSTTTTESSPSLKSSTADSSSSVKTASVVRVPSDVSTKQAAESSASARITIISSGGTAVEAAAKPAGSTSVSVPASSGTIASVSSVSPSEVKKDGLRQTDGQTAAFSPKDDYKLRRQSRSKTLPEQPVSKDEQFATKVQRTASHRVEPTSSQSASPEASPSLRVAGARKVQEAAEKDKTAEPATKNEPEWFALARRKTGRREEKEETSEAAPAAPVKEVVKPKETLAISPAELQNLAPRSESSTPAKPEHVNTALKSSEIQSVSSATSKFEKSVEVKETDVTRTPVRGGSVKTSPTKVSTAPAFANRGSSVKVTSTKSDFPRKETPATNQPAAAQVSTTPSVTASPVKHDVKKEEPKPVETSPTKEVPKWKTQSMKTTPSASAGPSATPVSSRFGSVKSSSSTTAATPSSTSITKTEPKTASPMKTSGLNKTSAVEAGTKEQKEKSSVPAWRANLGQKKHDGLGKDIKIELIESKSSTTASAAAGGQKKEDTPKKPDSPTKTQAGNVEMQTDQCRGSASSRSSKVLDMVKNFQKLQVT